ncbi:hypothetical protein [Tortoise microvirus 29]|nr:hypothetical protein [Tortoise microvirus 29]
MQKKVKNVEQSSAPTVFVRKQLNYNLGDYITDFDQSSGKSETTPDQAKTPSELVKLYYSGMSFAGGQTPQYSELEIPDLKKMDLVEVDQYREKLLKQRRETEEALRIASQEQAKKYDEERQRQALEIIEEIKKRSSTQNNNNQNDPQT